MPQTLDYQQAGVNISAGNSLVERIKPLAEATRRAEVLAGVGGFNALFELPIQRYQQPVLVSATDGVGTKLRLALAANQHHTIGIDLVAMCVNDLLVCGAEPLFFLDYYASGQLDIAIAAEVIAGISKGCQQAKIALMGGETAEMPGHYQGQDYDLAGFCVGVVEKSAIIDGSKVQAGDQLIGIAASGVHANGYSLVRKILEVTQTPLTQPFEHSTLAEVLLTPTKIYVDVIRQLLTQVPIHAMAHITGGGIVENLPRVMPPHTAAKLAWTSWPRPAIFDWLQQQGQIAEPEMRRVFNLGVGVILVVPATAVTNTLSIISTAGETAWCIGEIVSTAAAQPLVLTDE